MDAVDPDLVDGATAAVTSVTGITDVRELRIRWIGHTLRAEADATVDPDITVATIHASPAGAHRSEPAPHS